MEAEEIDKLNYELGKAMESINMNDELHKILKKYLNSELPENVLANDFNNEEVLKLWSNLMKKIENGAYYHFWHN